MWVRAHAEGAATLHVSADEIDRLRLQEGKNLNQIELEGMAALVAKAVAAQGARPRLVVVDSPDPNPERFGAALQTALLPLLPRDGTPLRVVAENGADTRYVIVAAASVLAKVERDEAIQQLQVAVGSDIGSGYTSDRVTRAFLHEQHAHEAARPPSSSAGAAADPPRPLDRQVRRSWVLRPPKSPLLAKATEAAAAATPRAQPAAPPPTQRAQAAAPTVPTVTKVAPPQSAQAPAVPAAARAAPQRAQAPAAAPPSASAQRPADDRGATQTPAADHAAALRRKRPPPALAWEIITE